ncbi:MAG: hypothetical protein HOM14_04485 [Gammaproteobacteria bacterium]|nr:hypothetical protein [Gammaproteobacteria bacterium]MBT3723464.1 hypothetical protein [Gammaproteobacteria bacterium]MBT4077275.1 hypothetical protein [Gammaproteobacteria bacterium]MBT4196225.1 hypothetical protein [Gammaproteobacteria bacterium]MBT4451968.1 hypothetical protein [Gammaproteobacteria bacterium]
MNKILTAIIILLLLVIGGGFYKFMIQGSTTESTDGRLAIQLNAGERDMVLGEMRAFLDTVQKIVKGVSEDDMKLVADSARKVGMSAQGDVPGSLVGKLPMKFKKLGFDTHTKFDQIALDASDMGDKDNMLIQLSVLMQNCVGCHAAYRIELEM